VPVRILFVISELSLGGAERQLLVLARALMRAGYEVSVAVFRRGSAMEADPAAAGIQLQALAGRGPLEKMVSLRRLVARWRPDVVHGYLTVGNIAALTARLVVPRPLIAWGVRASDMQMEVYPLKWRLAAQIERHLAPLADLLITNSKAGLKTLLDRGVTAGKALVIENGIDLSRFTASGGLWAERRATMRRLWAIDETQTVIGHVARIDPMKDHATFFAGLAHAAGRRADIHGVAVAVGSDDAREALRRRAIAEGLGKRLTIVGPVSDIADAYPGFDVFCSSSAWGEGFSNVIAEALASGVPTVATDVGNAAELVGDAGQCVPPSDPAALGAALLAVTEARKIMATRARMRVADFGPDRLAARTVAALAARHASFRGTGK